MQRIKARMARARIQARELFKQRRHQRGATMIEYALLAALLSVAAITGVTSVGKTSKNTFNVVADNISASGGEIEPPAPPPL